VIEGNQHFGTRAIPGWVPQGEAIGKDPRAVPHGPMKWGDYKGIYYHDTGVALKYTVGGLTVLESPSMEKVGSSSQAFVRHLNITGTGAAQIVVCEEAADAQVLSKAGVVVIKRKDGRVVAVGANGAALSVQKTDFGHAVVAAVSGARNVKLSVWTGSDAAAGDFKTFIGKGNADRDLSAMTAGGKPRWPDIVTVAGKKAEDVEGAAYVVDDITLPEPNPAKAWMRPSGFDFFADNDRAAVCTWSGDVWIVSGLQTSFAALKWQRVATGLYHPLGLKIVDDVIYVNCRDQICRLHDLNGDGEADFYEAFNNDMIITKNFHEFSFDLHTDPEGNFYFSKAGPVKHGGKGFDPVMPHHGSVFKLSKDGKTLQTYATGVRAPNGMGMSPEGQVTTSDNEGTNIPTTPINWVREGGFYGVKVMAHKTPVPKRDMPLTWIPHNVDNSGGGQAFVTSDKWGPYQGELIHLSYGTCRLLHVFKEEVDGQMQGGVVLMDIDGRINSGIMRARFNAADGQLYVGGLKGWQTRSLADGGLHRIRYTGGKVYKPRQMAIGKNGVKITFTQPLDPDTAEDPGNYSMEQWNYSFTEAYGSKHYSLERPGENGHDDVDIVAATLIDERTVFLEVPAIQVVHQMHVTCEVKAADGTQIKADIYNTIHKLGDWTGKSKEGGKLRPGQLPKETIAALNPGLIMTTTSGTSKDSRAVRMPALYVGDGEAASVFAEPGKFLGAFNGYIKQRSKGKVTISAEGTGRVALGVNGQAADMVTTGELSAEVSLVKGYNMISVGYAAPATGPAVLRLFWEGDDFVREPIPPSAFVHDSRDEALLAGTTLRRGRTLYKELNCAACHDGNGTVAAPALDRLSRRLNTEWVTEWLRNPHSTKHDSRMPNVLAPLPLADAQKAAADIAAYITEGAERVPAILVDETVAKGNALFHKFGCMNCHIFDKVKAVDQDKLYLGGAAAKFQTGRMADFIRDPAKYNAHSKMPNFRLSESEAIQLEQFIRSRAVTSVGGVPLAAGDAVAGKEAFTEMRCVNCHALDAAVPEKVTPILGAPKGGGCLAPDKAGRGGAPNFKLSADDRGALEAFLATRGESLSREVPAEFADHAVKALRCVACHSNDGTPSRWSQRENAPAVLPPDITWTGDKLQTEWLQKLLAGSIKETSRPWLESRMPGFGSHAPGLAKGLAARHGYGPETRTVEGDKAIGENLVGINGGFACITCHAVGGTKALAAFEAPGINLKTSAERLRHDYYYRWMMDPKRIDQQTKMPRFSVDKEKTGFAHILDGDATAQFNAIWEYLKGLE
jgi:glucose/arabinose dehydrogenase/mono/diheme cytochrome c family protein